MTESADLLLFEHLVRKCEGQRGLDTAALLVAEAEYPDLNVAAYLRKLDHMGRRARRLIALHTDTGLPQVAPVLNLVYDHLGFRGNVSEYYDPRNSFLNDVLDRRLGIPISLALILISTCQRAGAVAEGVSFPGHFLVRSVDVDGNPLFIDPFDGRVLDNDSLQLLYEQATGDLGEMNPECLEPATRIQILSRMLNNLRAIYEVRGDRQRLRRILQRIAILTPSDDIESRLALLGHNVPLLPRATVN